MKMNAPDDFRQLRELLTSWQLAELFEHLQAEGINIAELQLMKPQHVAELLHNYKLGVRIRFEHYFELWRRRLNKPLTQCHNRCTACCGHVSPLPVATPAPVPTPVPISQLSRATNTCIIEYADAQTNTNWLSSPLPPPLPPALPPVLPLLPQSSREMAHDLPRLTPQPKRPALELPTCPIPSSTATAAALPPPVVTSPQELPMSPLQMDPPLLMHLQNALNPEPVSLMEILTASGGKGASLLRYYKEHQELTSTHRALLISLIVNFFDENEYHLSLNMSHNLEKQILRLFPTEQLVQYRTEKRGKIYVKFCNMKRYRRDRPSIKRKWEGSLQYMKSLPKEGDYTESNAEDDEFLMGFENWHDQQVQVKTEHFPDEDSVVYG